MQLVKSMDISKAMSIKLPDNLPPYPKFVEEIRTKIHGIEGRFGRFYFNELIKLIPEFRSDLLLVFITLTLAIIISRKVFAVKNKTLTHLPKTQNLVP